MRLRVVDLEMLRKDVQVKFLKCATHIQSSLTEATNRLGSVQTLGILRLNLKSEEASKGDDVFWRLEPVFHCASCGSSSSCSPRRLSFRSASIKQQCMAKFHGECEPQPRASRS